jgi:hypothetical protein
MEGSQHKHQALKLRHTFPGKQRSLSLFKNPVKTDITVKYWSCT